MCVLGWGGLKQVVAAEGVTVAREGEEAMGAPDVGGTGAGSGGRCSGAHASSIRSCEDCPAWRLTLETVYHGVVIVICIPCCACCCCCCSCLQALSAGFLLPGALMTRGEGDQCTWCS